MTQLVIEIHAESLPDAPSAPPTYLTVNLPDAPKVIQDKVVAFVNALLLGGPLDPRRPVAGTTGSIMDGAREALGLGSSGGKPIDPLMAYATGLSAIEREPTIVILR